MNKMSTDTAFHWDSYVSPIQFDSRKDIKVGDILRMKKIGHQANSDYDNAVVEVLDIKAEYPYYFGVKLIEAKTMSYMPKMTSWHIDGEIWDFEFVVDEWDK